MKLAFCILRVMMNELYWICQIFLGKNHEENVMTLENTDDRIIFYYT